MPTVKIPFPLSNAPGAFNQEESGRLLNCYAEPLGKTVGTGKGTATPAVVWRKSPGVSQFALSPNPGFRGGILVGNVLYAAWNEKASFFFSNAAETQLAGALSGTDKVFWARNNKTTPDVVAVAPLTGAYIVTTTTVTSYSVSVPSIGVPNSVGFLDGYFIFTYADGTMQASDLNATTINTLNRTTEQAKPGGLLRGLPFNGQYYVWGPAHGAVYSDTAQPTGFPFTRSYVIQRGLLSRYAVAGHEDGFGSALIWVADDKSVVMANGTPNPTKISPPDLDRLIDNVVDKNTLEASVYISQGHPKWVLSCPSFTWEFDIGSQKWNERTSYLASRWRMISGISAFGQWLGGDVKSNRLIFVDDNAFDELGDPLIMQIESGPVQKFPSRTKVAVADFDFVVGVGRATESIVMNVSGAAAGTGGVIRLTVNGTAGVITGDTANVANVGGTVEANGVYILTLVDDTHVELQGTVFVHPYTTGGTVSDVTPKSSAVDPTVGISWSNNGGFDYGHEIIRKLGRQSEVENIRVLRTGQTTAVGRRWRLKISGQVYAAFLGGSQDTTLTR